MKKAFIASAVILSLALPHLLAAGTIRNMRTGTTYSTIQGAIDAALPGDTIGVTDGEYGENLEIKEGQSALTIEGAGAGRTFLNLSTLGGTAVTFENVTGSTIRGFTIKRADVGIRARKSKPYATNNIFSNNVTAFENRSSYSRVINNTFYSNTRAVFTNYSSTLTNNIISGSEGHAIAGGRAGSIRHNLFSGNTLGNYSGISEPPASFNNITGNPLFVDPSADFHLKAGSPAINKGDPSVRDAFDNSVSDIGVYGGPKADVKPATVTGVRAASSQTQVTVSWNRNLAYSISDHRVYYGRTFGNHTSSYVSAGNAGESVFTNLSTNRRYCFAVRAVDGNGNKSDFSSAVYGAIDTNPPPAPANLRAEIGDQRLYLSWDAATDDESGVRGYKVYYGTSPGNYGAPIDVSFTSHELTGLTNGITYYIAVSAYDYAGNEGPLSAEVSEAPQEIRGIEGLKETGGCFIATAAYGSYEERHVKILREFRDRYLLNSFEFRVLSFEFKIPNIAGRAFVKAYYKASPPVADFIRGSEALKAVVRVALLPVIGVAWMLISYPLLTLGCTGFLFIFTALTGLKTCFYGIYSGLIRSLKTCFYETYSGLIRSLKTCFYGIYSGLIRSLKTCFYETYNGLIRRNMASAMLRIFILSFFILLFNSSISLGGERTGLSFGLSYGQIEPSGDEWKEIYGDERVSNYRASLGYWFHPDIGVEGSISYLKKDGKGKTITGMGTGADTTFQAAPVGLTVLYRLKYREEQLLVPYIGAGVLYEPYWEKVEDGKEIKGGMWGHHLTGGLQLLLDNFDRSSARSLQEDYGIDNTYLAFAATHSVIDDFGGEDVDLGGWNYSVGLMFEF
jgi:hypothetical protein